MLMPRLHQLCALLILPMWINFGRAISKLWLRVKSMTFCKKVACT